MHERDEATVGGVGIGRGTGEYERFERRERVDGPVAN